MSLYAKSLVAAVAAVLIAGVQAWQVTVAGQPFRSIDLLPIATATVGAFYTYLVPEVPELQRAKTWIASGFAVLTALCTFVTGHPADVTVLNLLIAGLSAVTVHCLPNLPLPALAVLGHAAADAVSGHADLGEITDALAELAPAAPPSADLTPTAPIPTAPAGPLPIEAQALAATTATQAFPAVTS